MAKTTAKVETPKVEKAPKTEKKTEKKADPKTPRAPKEGLRTPQVRVLKVLVKAKSPMTRKQIAEKADLDPTKVGDYVGPRPETQSEETQARWKFRDLVSLKLVKVLLEDTGTRSIQTYEITAAGKAAVAKMK